MTANSFDHFFHCNLEAVSLLPRNSMAKAWDRIVDDARPTREAADVMFVGDSCAGLRKLPLLSGRCAPPPANWDDDQEEKNRQFIN